MGSKLYQVDSSGEIRGALGGDVRGFALVPAVPSAASREYALGQCPVSYPVLVTPSSGGVFQVTGRHVMRGHQADWLTGAKLSGMMPGRWLQVITLESPDDVFLFGPVTKVSAMVRDFYEPQDIAPPNASTPADFTATPGQTGWNFYFVENGFSQPTYPLEVTVWQKTPGFWLKSSTFTFTATEKVQYLDVLSPGDVYLQAFCPGSRIRVEGVFEQG